MILWAWKAVLQIDRAGYRMFSGCTLKLSSVPQQFILYVTETFESQNTQFDEQGCYHQSNNTEI